MAGEITSLRTHNENLQKRINELTGLNETSMVNLNDELQQERRKFASTVEELSILKEQLALAQTEMKAAVEAKLTAEKKYTDEMLQHTNDIKVNWISSLKVHKKPTETSYSLISENLSRKKGIYIN